MVNLGQLQTACNDLEEKMRQEYEQKIEDLKRNMETKLKSIEDNFRGQVEALHKTIERKDNTIANLSTQIGELKTSCDFLSKETSDIKNEMKDNAITADKKIRDTKEKMFEIKIKTVDLEDRSRRSNLVFYNFPETEGENASDCEGKIITCLEGLNIFASGEEIYIDRAHRLGRKKEETDAKPRPIIAKFSYFKQKNQIVMNGKHFKNTTIKFSEDYSKETIKEHKQLREYAKEAQDAILTKDTEKSITMFRVTYRRVVLTYSTNKHNTNAQTFKKGFTLRDIYNNTNWYIPLQR